MAFCPEYSNSEAPISVITNILTKKDLSKLEKITNEFELLGFDKVKDLANSSFEKVNTINGIGEDPIPKLYEAFKIYAEYCANQLESAKFEYYQKNFYKTQKICLEMLSHKPNDLELLMLLAESYFDCKDYDTCITYLKEVYAKNPNCVEVLNNIGLCYFEKSQFTKAAECFYEVVNKNPTFTYAWIHLAKTLILLEEKNETSVAALYSALRNKPNLYHILNEHLQLLLHLNETEISEKRLKFSAKIITLKNTATVYFIQKNWLMAINTYKKVLKLQPDDLDSNLQLGKIYCIFQEDQEAEKYFKIILKLNPQNEEIHKYLIGFYKKLGKKKCAYEAAISFGDMLYDRNDYENAKKVYNGALDFDRKNVIGHWKLGNTMYKLGDFDSAFARYKTCIKLKPTFTEAYIVCGLLFDIKNLPEKALDYFQKAYALEPNNSIILQYLPRIKEKQG